MNETYTVAIADMKTAKNSGTLITYALGSCVGVSMYDPIMKVAGLLHIILPQSNNRMNEPFPYKFADTGIAQMIKDLTRLGGNRRNFVCKIAGGAKMFKGENTSFLGNIGERNIETVKQSLMREGLRIKSEDVGGGYARTMSVDVKTGDVFVRTIGRPQTKL